MDALEALFASPARAKCLKMFFMNPDSRFSVADGSRQTKLRPAQFLAEARRLIRLKIIGTATSRVMVALGGKPGRRQKLAAARIPVFFANRDYPLFPELRNLIVKSAPHAKGQLAAKIRRLGAVKLAILAGVFIDSADSRVDLFVVGDGMRQSRVKSFIQWLEHEVGKELNYVAMSSAEFKYRMDMYDRFVRDILEFPHETVINKLGV